MLNYIILINKKMEAIIIDYQTAIKGCTPEVGCIAEFDGWITNDKDLIKDDDFFGHIFDEKKAFKESGLYRVLGYDDSVDTEDGYYDSYCVIAIEKLQDIKY